MALAVLTGCIQKKNNDATKTFYVAADLTPENVFTTGIEGPAVDREGFLYVVNYGENGTIGMVTPEGESNLFVTLPDGSVGNGIRFHSDGSMLIADYTLHNILKVDMDSRKIDVYAHDGRMNQPNDLAIASDNTLYLSDPNWADSTGMLWKVTPDGNTILLEANMGTTNGVEVSPGDDILYVSESIQRNVWAYDLSPEGEIRNKRLFYEFPDFGLDGMRCDREGNLYVTRYGKGTVVILSPGGEILKEVPLKGKNASNIAFGGPDGKTCYVTLQDRGCVETFRSEIAGREW
jgi:sugar lactone lactonase YvrE